MLLTSETKYKQVGLTLHFYCNEIDFFFLICQWFFSPSGRYHGCQKFLISLTLNSNLWTFFPAWMIVNLALLGLLLLFKYQRRQSCRTLIAKNRSEQRSVFRQKQCFLFLNVYPKPPRTLTSSVVTQGLSKCDSDLVVIIFQPAGLTWNCFCEHILASDLKKGQRWLNWVVKMWTWSSSVFPVSFQLCAGRRASCCGYRCLPLSQLWCCTRTLPEWVKLSLYLHVSCAFVSVSLSFPHSQNIDLIQWIRLKKILNWMNLSTFNVSCSEKAQQLAQAWLHRARRWVEASAGWYLSVYQGAAEQDLPKVHANLDTCTEVVLPINPATKAQALFMSA